MKNNKLINAVVFHDVYGEGIITTCKRGRVEVIFVEKRLKFVYPDAFEKFLTLKDSKLGREILSEISAKKQQIEGRRQSALEVYKSKQKSRNMSEKSTIASSLSWILENKFGPDYHIQYLAKRPIFTYKQVEEKFGISISGFGRGINSTPSNVVLISSINNHKGSFVYHDRWTAEGDYLYSGEGKNGDQSLTGGNKAIVDAARKGKTIHLFVKFSPKEYYYQGIFSLVKYTYEEEYDETGNIRKEYKFLLRRELKI